MPIRGKGGVQLEGNCILLPTLARGSNLASLQERTLPPPLQQGLSLFCRRPWPNYSSESEAGRGRGRNFFVRRALFH